MNKKRTVFLTGVTGLVGSYLSKLLLEEGCKVYALARRKGNKNAKERALDALRFWNEESLNKNFNNLLVIEGDVGREGLDLDKRFKDLLKKDVSEFFHCAAVTEFNWPLERIRKVNVGGTKNILNVALSCENLKKVNHISTVYVGVRHKDIFTEGDLSTKNILDSSYAQSKAEAERLVQAYRKKGLWIDIFRPSFIVGESSTGKVNTFSQLFYQLLRIWNLELFDKFPAKSLSIDMTFVDDVCKAILDISSKCSVKNSNYHPFPSKPVLLERILDVSSKYLGFKKPCLIPFNKSYDYGFTPTQRMVIKYNIFPITSSVRLDSTTTKKILRKYNFKFSEFNDNSILKMIKYAVKTGFLKKRNTTILAKR